LIAITLCFKNKPDVQSHLTVLQSYGKMDSKYHHFKMCHRMLIKI